MCLQTISIHTYLYIYIHITIENCGPQLVGLRTFFASWAPGMVLENRVERVYCWPRCDLL